MSVIVYDSEEEVKIPHRLKLACDGLISGEFDALVVRLADAFWCNAYIFSTGHRVTSSVDGLGMLRLRLIR